MDAVQGYVQVPTQAGVSMTKRVKSLCPLCMGEAWVPPNFAGVAYCDDCAALHAQDVEEAAAEAQSFRTTLVPIRPNGTNATPDREPTGAS